jgi:hypothetical protein
MAACAPRWICTLKRRHKIPATIGQVANGIQQDQTAGMFGTRPKQFPNRLAALAALFALIWQALYAVPAAERMMLGEDLAPGQATVICFAHGSGGTTANVPGLPGKTKTHCPLCIAAAFTALAAVIWLIGTLVAQAAPSPLLAARVLLPVRLPRAHRSRAPPALI